MSSDLIALFQGVITWTDGYCDGKLPYLAPQGVVSVSQTLTPFLFFDKDDDDNHTY